MSRALLFLPDISGFTEFVNSTEVEHSQHVIAELLEILLSANQLDLQLAEIEGDALFFYRDSIPSADALLAQMESMFTAFYEHLQLLEHNRICPCHACASAPNLQLKIIAHSGPLQFISVRNTKKPFGPEVIQAHRLMKNSVESNNYVLISQSLASDVELPSSSRDLFRFETGSNHYDNQEIHYHYSIVLPQELSLTPPEKIGRVHFEREPNFTMETEFPIPASTLMEYITNYQYRQSWTSGVDDLKYNEHEVTRLGTTHVCVLKTGTLDFEAVTKEGKEGQLVYGEMTSSPPPVDRIYQFYIVEDLPGGRSKLTNEVFWEARSPIKKGLIALIFRRVVVRNVRSAIDQLQNFVERRHSQK
ncbi:MAG: DUF2652 domain-containing protein [Saprospiraceae bacterium]|nr:DUF2652 domain-containing protein [Saprospiraceae bacterium]